MNFLHPSLCIVLGIAIGFHILPYFFNTKNMDILLETGIEVGRFSVYQDFRRSAIAIVKEDVVLIYPDSSSTYYIVLNRGY